MTVTLGGDTAVPALGVLERPHLVCDHGCFIFPRAGTTHSAAHRAECSEPGRPEQTQGEPGWWGSEEAQQREQAYVGLSLLGASLGCGGDSVQLQFQEMMTC